MTNGEDEFSACANGGVVITGNGSEIYYCVYIVITPPTAYAAIAGRSRWAATIGEAIALPLSFCVLL